ncbi:hypothetical protein JOD97_005032 [Duganella sp. 1411]|nr:hypothetical protein [Duganella sp. 1411]
MIERRSNPKPNGVVPVGYDPGTPPCGVKAGVKVRNLQR